MNTTNYQPIIIAVVVLALIGTFASGVSLQTAASTDQVPYVVLRACYHDAMNNLFTH